MSGIASFVTQTGHVIAFVLGANTVGMYTPIVITVCQLIGTFISIPLLRRYEWRNITLIGGFILCACDIIAGVLFYQYYMYKWRSFALWVIMVVISIFMFTFGVTFGSSVWPYISYMMPSKHIQAALVINWILAGLSLVAFSVVTAVMGNPFIMLWVYGGITFILSVYNSIEMIEIKGLSFKKVQLKLQ